MDKTLRYKIFLETLLVFHDTSLSPQRDFKIYTEKVWQMKFSFHDKTAFNVKDVMHQSLL